MKQVRQAVQGGQGIGMILTEHTALVLQELSLVRFGFVVASHLLENLGEIRARVARLPGLELAGAYLDGISVSDALNSGLDAARALQGVPRHS